jgi:hypothetical protein
VTVSDAAPTPSASASQHTSPPPDPTTRLPRVAPPPDVAQAEAAVSSALVRLHAAAMSSVSKGSVPALTAATRPLNVDLATVQKNFDQANAAGLLGDCAGSFAASRAADDVFNQTKRDVEAVSRYVSSVRQANTHYASARRGALHALQELYNAIAGHPLQAKPSDVVASMQATMTSDDAATAAATTNAGAVLTAARQALGQAKKAASDAALAPCLDVSA